MDARFTSCFNDWLAQQESDIDELELILASPPSPANDDQLRAAVIRNIIRLQEYSDRRMLLAREDPPAFMSPKWCSSFERSFLCWLGGCRPSLLARLVCGDSGVLPIGGSGSTGGGIEGVTLTQKCHIDQLGIVLDCKEQEMDWNMGKVQKGLAEERLVMLATKKEEGGGTSNGSGGNEPRAVLDEHAAKLLGMMEDAEALRIAALKRVAVEILTPRQAAQFLVAMKKIHLKLHDWGIIRDLERGRGGV